MGSKRVGLARVQALIENLKRSLDLNGASLTDIASIETQAEGSVTCGQLQVDGGRILDQLEKADLDAQDGTLTVERISKGILVHTTVTGQGTLTSDTAANIIAGHSGVGALTKNNQTIEVVVVNDGDRALDFAAGNGVTFLNGSGSPVVAANGACRIVFRRTGAAAVDMIVLAE